MAGLTVVNVPVPDTVATFGAWVASSLTKYTAAGLSAVAANGDKIAIYGSATGAGDQTAKDAQRLGSISVVGTTVYFEPRPDTWAALPYLTAIRDAGSSIGLNTEIIGTDATSISGEVTAIQGNSNDNPAQGWSSTLTNAARSAYINPATSDNQTNGSQISQIKSGEKGTSPAALVTSRSVGADHQAVDIAINDASGNLLGGDTAHPVNTLDGSSGPPGAATPPADAMQIGGVSTETGKLVAAQIGANGGALTQATRASGAEDTSEQGTYPGTYGVTAVPITGPKYSPLSYRDPGSAIARVVVAQSVNVLALQVVNSDILFYLLLYNLKSLPAVNQPLIPGTDFSFPVPAASGGTPYTLIIGNDFFGPNGRNMAYGATWACSTDQDKYVAIGSATTQRVTLVYSRPGGTV